MKKIEYFIFNPGGNLTALVFDNHYNKTQRKNINDVILKKHKCVEQVGFISNNNLKLQMAGGEFCGNATRCAVKYYLDNNFQRECLIKVSGIKEKLLAGIDNENKVWVDVPIKSVYKSNLAGINIVEIEGITHIVLNEEQSKKYLNNKEKLKDYAKEMISKIKINDKAIGVLFTEIKDKFIKLYPIIWVKDIDTFFYETACGSGTVAVGACSTENEIAVLQPSGYEITTKKLLKNEKEYIRITGVVITDMKIRNIEEELV